MQQLRKTATATVSAILSVAVLSAAQKPAEAFGLGGDVLAPDAIVQGYSLTDAAEEIALWQDTFDPAFLPNVPYQPLTLANLEYTVAPGTYLYIPISSANNSPPILGTFPTDLAQAVTYFFDPDQIGGKDFKITVNGKETPIGAAYLAGPVSLPLPLGGNSSIILGAFLAPLEPGVHTVNIKGQFNGTLVREVYADFCESSEVCLSQDTTYTVTAVPEPTTMAGLALAGAGIGVLRCKKSQKSA